MDRKNVHYIALNRTISLLAFFNMTSQLKNLIGSVFFGGLLIAVTIKFINKDINIELSKANQITGKVVNCGVIDKSSIVGGRMKVKVKGKVFFIKLENSRETFATYRPRQDYSSLSDRIKNADQITIYYDPANSGELNLDVYQIEKNGEVIQDYESYNNNYKIGAWFTGIGGLGILVIGLFPYIKKRMINK